jgi:hypothetical protein
MLTEPAIPAPPPARTRVAPIVTGSIVALLATVLFAVGALALWADGRGDSDGYHSTGDERYATTGHAIVTEDLDIDDVPNWLADGDDLGTVRVKASAPGERPVFVGIARSDDVREYLRGVEHATLTDVDYSPFDPVYEQNPGARRPLPPASQGFWETSAHGPGTQTVSWDVDEGEWSIVVMNENGSKGVDARVDAGVKLPWLAAIGWSALGGSLVLLVVSGGLIYLGVRSPRTRAR